MKAIGMILSFLMVLQASADLTELRIDVNNVTNPSSEVTVPFTAPLKDGNGVSAVLRDVFGSGSNSPNFFSYHSGPAEAQLIDYIYEDWGGVCDPNNPQIIPSSMHIHRAVGFQPYPSSGNNLRSPINGTPRSCQVDESRSQGTIFGKPQITRMARMIRACQMMLLPNVLHALTLPFSVGGNDVNVTPIMMADQSWKIIKTAIDRMNLTPQNPHPPNPNLYQYNDPIGYPANSDFIKAYQMFFPGSVPTQPVLTALQNVVNASNARTYDAEQDRQWYAWRSVFLVLCMTPTWQLK